MSEQLALPTTVTRAQLPPGPGNLHLVKMLFNLNRWNLLELVRQYGDPMTLPTLFGPMVVAAAPEGIKALFTADPDTFVSTIADAFRGVLSESVLAQSGAAHRRSRKLLAPPFHGARMRAYGNLMREAARRWTERWQPGQPFAMLDTTQAITLDVIVSAVFGVTGGDQVRSFRQDVLDWVGSFSPLVMVPSLRRNFLGLGPWARFSRHHNRLRDRVLSMISEYRPVASGREDVLSMLLSVRDDQGDGLSEGEIIDQLVTMVIAGHETTAVALAWAFYELHRNPEAMARLQAELATLPAGDLAEPEAIARLPYLEAVCNETLRLYPPSHIIHRRLTRPLNVLGWELPAGAVVAAGVYATHRLESLYPEPERFQPERFLARTYSPFEFLPWGGGARRCLGAPFAMYEMKLVLATVLRERRLRLLETGPVPLAHRPGTVGPKSGIRMALAD